MTKPKSTLSVPTRIIWLFAEIGKALNEKGNGVITKGVNYVMWENEDFGRIRIVHADDNLCFYFLLMRDGKAVIDISGQVKNEVTLKRRLRAYLKRVVVANTKRKEKLIAEIEKLTHASRELESRSIKQLDFEIEHT